MPQKKKRINKKSQLPPKTQEKRKPSSKAKKRKRKRNKRIPPKSKSKKLVVFLWNLIFYVVMLTILFGAGLSAFLQQSDKSIQGYRMFGVLTNSMVSPDDSIKPGGFRAGDIVIIKDTAPENIKVNDVITYHPSTNPTNKSTNYLTHRVVKINDELGNDKGIFYVTRGDANKADDMPISSEALVGKVIFRIPKIAGILRFIKENLIVSIVFLASVTGFIWVMRLYVLSEPKKKRRKKNHGIASKEVNIKTQKRTRGKHK